MAVVLLTETLHYQPIDRGRLTDIGRVCSMIFPGACDAEYLRGEIGDDLFDTALRIGVLVSIP